MYVDGILCDVAVWVFRSVDSFHDLNKTAAFEPFAGGWTKNRHPPGKKQTTGVVYIFIEKIHGKNISSNLYKNHMMVTSEFSGFLTDIFRLFFRSRSTRIPKNPRMDLENSISFRIPVSKVAEENPCPVLH